MNRHFLLVALAALLTISATAQTNRHNAEISKRLDIFNALYNELDLYFVDSLQAKKVLGNATAYMLSRLDPYTAFYAEDETEELRQMTTGKYAGVGAVISYRAEEGRCIIAEPYEGMPAAEAGLRHGDIIMAIDGKELYEPDADSAATFSSKVSDMLRGQPETTFELSYKRPGVKKAKTTRIKRRDILLPTVTLADLIADSIGYICLNGFTEQTGRDMRIAVTELKQRGARRLVLDLRGNPGGLMGEAVKVVNLFIPRGHEVVSTKGKRAENNITLKTLDRPLDTEIPLAVLTDYGTGSAAEITAGALQDYDRAVVVGQRTYGKGLVQESRELPYNTVVKLTTARYYIPSGRCVQAYKFEDGEPVHLPDSLSKLFHTAGGRPVRDSGGITPDVMLPADSLPNLVHYLSASDVLFDFATQYRNAHPTIAPAARFKLTAEEYDDFCAYLKENDFTYDRQSLRMLDGLRRIARLEGYAEEAKGEFDALEAKLKHNEDFDFRRWEKEIRRIAECAIVSRYYYESGATRYLLSDDETLREALRILTDNEQYRQLLSAPAKTKEKREKGAKG